LYLVEHLQSPEILAIVADFVAVHGFHDSLVFDEFAECVEGSLGGVFGGDLRGDGDLTADLFGMPDVFEAPDPELFPFADGHVFDEQHLSFGLGLVFGDYAGEESFEALGEFAVYEDGAGYETVPDGVLGGD
jgi:hypothetical protein